MLISKCIQLKVIWSLICLNLKKNTVTSPWISIPTNWHASRSSELKIYVFKNLMIRKLLLGWAFLLLTSKDLLAWWNENDTLQFDVFHANGKVAKISAISVQGMAHLERREICTLLHQEMVCYGCLKNRDKVSRLLWPSHRDSLTPSQIM